MKSRLRSTNWLEVVDPTFPRLAESGTAQVEGGKDTDPMMNMKQGMTRGFLAVVMMLALAGGAFAQDQPEPPSPQESPAPESTPQATPESAPETTPSPTPAETQQQDSPPAESAPADAPADAEGAVTPQPGDAPAAAGERPSRQPTVRTPQFERVINEEALRMRVVLSEFVDAQDGEVIEGGEFETDVMLTNPRGREWDEVLIVLRYDPSFLDPLTVNDSPISANLSGAPTAYVDRNLGRIVYHARLSTPVRDLSGPLIFIRWQAIRPSLFTRIGWDRTRDGEYTDVFRNGARMLGDPPVLGDGVTSLNLKVIPADPAEALAMREEPGLYLGTDQRVGGITISVLNPVEPVRVGDEFLLDIYFDNSTYSMMDGVSLLMQYEAEYLEIIDDDFDNWITHGLNIHDGSFRSMFPFDVHISNAVYPGRGLIEYRKGASVPEDFLGVQGTMAQIRARAIAPTAGTSVRFLFAQRPGQRSTRVTYMGQNVLGNPDRVNDGVRGAYFPILPRD